MDKIYIAGKYTHETKEERESYCDLARSAMIWLLRKGHAVLCTFVMMEGFEHKDGLSYEQFMAMDKLWLQSCDGIYMLPNWKHSTGAKRELEWAKELGLKIYFDIKDVPEA